MSKYYKADEVEKLLSCGCAYAIRELPTLEASEDCISRVELRRNLARPLENNNVNEMYCKGWHDCTVAVETRIADAPSVIPQPKEGERPYFIDGAWCNLVGKEMKGQTMNDTINRKESINAILRNLSEEKYRSSWESGAVKVMKDTLEKMPTEDRPVNGVLFKGRLEEGNYNLIKTTDGWVLDGENIAYAGFNI